MGEDYYQYIWGRGRPVRWDGDVDRCTCNQLYYVYKYTYFVLEHYQYDYQNYCLLQMFKITYPLWLHHKHESQCLA